MFSSLPEGESLDEVKPNRIRPYSSLYENPIDTKEFADSVIIFDDTDVTSDRNIRERSLQAIK